MPQAGDVEQDLRLVHREPGIAVSTSRPITRTPSIAPISSRARRAQASVRPIRSLAMLDELAAGRVDRGQDLHRRAGALEQVVAEGEPVRARSPAIQQHDRRLLQPGHGLVDAAERDVGAAGRADGRHLGWKR